MRATAEQRFMARVDLGPTGCWEWLGATVKGGYGRFYIDGAHHVASRWAYAHFVGPIPEGMQVDHTCHAPGCVNPSHLRLLSPQDNSRHKRTRSDSTSGVRGAKYDKRSGRWAAVVTAGSGERLHLGMFPTAESAGEAARLKRIELFGAHLEPSNSRLCSGAHVGGEL